MFVLSLFACNSTAFDTDAPSLPCGDTYEQTSSNETTELGRTAAQLILPLQDSSFDVPADSPLEGAWVSVDDSSATATTLTSDTPDCSGHYQLLVEAGGTLSLTTEGDLPARLRFTRHDLPENSIRPRSFAIGVFTSSNIPSPELETYLMVALERPVQEVREYTMEAHWSEADGSLLLARPVYVSWEGEVVDDVPVELHGRLVPGNGFYPEAP